MTEEYFELNNGVKIPKVGIGTFRMPSGAAKKAVEAAPTPILHKLTTMKMVLVQVLEIQMLIAKIFS